MAEEGANRRDRRRARRSDARWAWLILLPALLGLVLFLVGPFVLAVCLGFTNYRLNSPLPTRWVGLANYELLFGEPKLVRALLNNLTFAAVVVPVQTAMALGLALLVDRSLRGMSVFRTCFFLPVVYPMALVSAVWALIFAPGEVGVANHLLHVVSFGAWDTSTDFLRNEGLALPAIMVMSIWQGVGFQMVVMLAGLQGIPAVLYESAALDGAGAFRRFRHVTLPELRNAIIFVMMITTIFALRLFDQVWILTQGGPNDATSTMLYEAYTASRERNQIGPAAAITVVFFVTVCSVALLQHLLVRQEREID